MTHDNMLSKLLVSGIMLTLILAVPTAAYAGAPTPGAIIIFVVDESGSMITEHQFLNDKDLPTSVAIAIESELNAEGINNVKFGLVGFGANSGHGTPGHKHLVNGDDLGTAAQFAVAADGLIVSGGTEDGYSGIDTALNSYTLTAGVPVQIILITDEDRDIVNAGLNFNNISGDLMDKHALLNVIVNCGFTDGQATILGIVKNDNPPSAALGTEFLADNAGGFTTQVGDASITCSGTSEGDYINIADLNSGAAWDLNQLRAGGLLADSFSVAFVDIKVEEIMRMVDPIVGGEFIPIDTTALLVAGAQTNAVWIMSALAVIGSVAFGALYITSKKN